MNKLILNVSPHISSPMDTKGMMKGVVYALLPATFVGLYFFKNLALGVIISCILGCVITEFLLQKLRRRKINVGDYSSVVTALLLALILPPSTPWWMAFLGGVFAIGLGKEVFGGLGNNPFNPALLSRAFLMAAFPVALTTWTQPVTLDTVTTATPLGLAKFNQVMTPYADLFFGNVSGSIGETSALALIIGGAYLFYRKIADYRAPLGYFITMIVFSGIMYLINPNQNFSPLFHILAGGFVIGAIFMVTDPVTTPTTKKGRWIFGIGCGVVTMTIRVWGGLPEGVMYSILLMNACTPIINKFSAPRRYGERNGK